MNIKTYDFEEFLAYKDFKKFIDSFPDFKDTWERFWAEFSEEDGCFGIHLAFVGRILVGIATSNIVRPYWGCRKDSPLNGARWLGNLEVNLDFRRRGHGSKFIQEITKEGKWILWADKENENFYKNLGFVSILKNKQERQIFVKSFAESEIPTILEDRYPYILLGEEDGIL